MLHLKIVMEMVDQLGSTALTQPEHILTFVAVVLKPKPSAAQSGKQHVNRSKTGLGFEDLRIVETEEEDGDSDADSDDEGPDDMLVTALNLLLAVLEAHPSLTPMNTQLLQVISDYLEPLSLHQADAVRPLAREARLVLTARKASTSASGASASTQQDDPQASIQAKYQQGLKLLQDPLLPVRAHGLVILREIVLSLRSGKTPTTTSTLDQALVPSILSIFLQMVQEDDSFIFLNAVQGLVAMVDVLGREILKGLVDVYTGGAAEGSLAYSLEKAELDKRVRVGEALGQSIRKCGDALPSYANMIIPPIFRMVRSTHLPTSLRSSALSLLAQCVETSKMAVLPWCSDLCAGILDLLQLESVTTSQTKPDKQKASSSEEDPNSPPKVSSKFDREIMDKQPLSVDPKLAPFRRSALHFLSLLIKSIVEDRVEVNPSPDFGLRPSTFRVAKSTALSEPELMQGVDEYMSQELVGRLRLFLRYMKATDVDDVVRVMAMEVLELVDSLQGLPQGLE
ncbi:hypothetical protein FRC02_009837 [Tulasnella sp. 418]|nr:hypothetical protein FRC02_009837 [Tulasnella sp. 418]